MDEFKPNDDERLRSKPFRRTNFTEEQMERVVAMAEQRHKARRGRSLLGLRYVAACTAVAAIVVIVLFANGVFPNRFLHTAEPSGTVDIAPSSASPTEETVPPLDLPDASYGDFSIPADLLTGLRDLEDARTNPDAVYRLHEYQVTGSLENIEKWLRNETERLGGMLTERYSYEAGSRPDFILKLPSKEGLRVVSTYAPKYENEQRLVILESTFNASVEFDENTEDHALIVTTPDRNGNTHETFLANYPHQHTDIYSLYFYSQAFFSELENGGYGLDLKYDLSVGVPDYTVGYFDENGKEVGYDELTEDNRDSFVFGIQLNNDFLPQNAAERELLLRCWAQTALMGDKAQSSAYEGEQKLNFLQNGKVFASYTIGDLLKGP